MHKIKLILTVAFALLVFTGCDEKKATSQKSEPVKKEQEKRVQKPETTVDKVAKSVITNVESAAQKVEQVAKDVQESTEPMVNEAVQKIKEVQKSAQTTTQEIKEKIVQETAPVVKAVKEAVAFPDGAELFVKCSGCHGKSAEKKALGKSQVIKEWDASKIANAIKGYKAGTYGGSMKALMKSQVDSLSDKEIDALSKYIADF